MGIPAVVAAGDRGAAKAIHGESKAFLEMGGRALVRHVVAALEDVPEVSEIWVVGDRGRLEALFREGRGGSPKPLRLLGQFDNLYENAWQSYRRLLPGAGPEGRDPRGAEADQQVLYVSGDLPFATPQEISSFVRRSRGLDCDYALGLVTAESMADFLPEEGSDRGIRMAAFNLREGRFRQSNLHLVRPARIGNRHYIQDMYRHRHQKELLQIVSLALRLLARGGLPVLWYYGLMHLAGFADWRGLRRLADAIRRWIPMARIERGCSDLLRTRFRFVVTEVGGCALDIDTEHDYEVSRERYAEWRARQEERAARLHGPVPPPGGGERARSG